MQRRISAHAGVDFQPNTLPGPRGILQFLNANVRIVDSSFSSLSGTPYTLVFNSSNVEFVNTTFTSNTGATAFFCLVYATSIG